MILAPENEFRFEISAGTTVVMTLNSGTAELFGAEMGRSHPYSFSGPRHGAIFTWHGCTLDIKGECQHSYVASETPMAHYMKLHAELEARRAAALASGMRGPCVLVAGPADTGKTSLATLLVNYAARCGRTVLLVELNLAHGALGLPGCLSATPMNRPIDIERHTDDLMPLSYWLGSPSAAEQTLRFRRLLKKIAADVRKRLAAQPATAGVVISTAGSVDNVGLDLLLAQITELAPDMLVVMGDDRLTSQLAKSAEVAGSPSPPPTVVKVPKSGGVISRSPESREAAMGQRWWQYFSGAAGELCPHSIELDIDAMQVYAINEAPQAPVSALPLGMQLPQDQLAASCLPAARFGELLHMLLAVVFSASGKCDDLLDAPVAGIIAVTAVDLKRQKITVLSPAPLPLPSNIFLSGSIKWRATTRS